jgi:glycosyltransferase involved in cell wall biosynthesis
MDVGVLLPVRNALRTVETCLTTIRDQMYAPGLRGAFVVDDASDDGTSEFLANRPDWYAKLERLPERRGWPAALNRAAELAIDDGCEALMICNADDFLRLDCIARCRSGLWRHDVDMVVPLVQQLGEENVVQASLDGASLGDFRDHTPIVAFAMIRADVWVSLGGYAADVNLPSDEHGDPMAGHNEMDFYIRFLKAGHNYVVLNEYGPLVYYRMHEGQLHRSIVRRHAEALRLIHTKHPEVLVTPPSSPEGEQ